MEPENEMVTDACELRPVIGLTRGLAAAELETLTIDAMLTHRQLVGKADKLFQALPDDYKTGIAVGGTQHLVYIEAMITMHAQMIALNTLLDILGYTPKVPAN